MEKDGTEIVETKGETPKLRNTKRLKKMLPKLLISFTVIFGVVMLCPVPAHASILGDFLNIDQWLTDMLASAAEGLLTAFMGFMQGISADTILTGSFGELLGSASGSRSVYTLVLEIHQIGVVPLAHSILALVMLVQLIKISQKIDATATMPAVKEVVFLAVFFVIFTWLINNSAELCAAVYNEINVLAKMLTGQAGGVAVDVTLGNVDGVAPGTMLVVLILALLMFVVGLIAWICSLLVAYARAIQIYVMTAFSPIPFALLGFEETRSFGVNFCKNFIAICLAGVIMVFLLVAFPLIFGTIVSESVSLDAGNLGSVADTFIMPVKMLAISLLLIVGLFKSGGWARDILGG